MNHKELLEKLTELLGEDDGMDTPNYWVWEQGEHDFLAVYFGGADKNRMDVIVGDNTPQSHFSPPTHRRWEDITPEGVLTIAEDWKDMGSMIMIDFGLELNRKLSLMNTIDAIEMVEKMKDDPK